MNIKAEAFQEYNQAAVIDKLFTGCRMLCGLLPSRSARWTR